MYRKPMHKHKVRAAKHRGRKAYNIPVKRDVHDKLMTVARLMHESPGAVIERLLKQ